MAPVPSVRTSERSTFKRCQQRWVWGYMDGLKPIRTKNPLWFGTGIHLALAEWYQPGFKRGPHPAQTWASYAKDTAVKIPQEMEDDELTYRDAYELGIEMMENYVDRFKRDENWDVISTEQIFKYLIRDRKTRRLIARYLGTFDGVYRDSITGEIWLMEHKTAAQIIITHLPLDDQAGSYLFVAEAVLKAAGLMKPNEVIAGIMYNFLRKKGKDLRPVNADGKATNKPTKAHFIKELASTDRGEKGLEKLSLSMLKQLADDLGIKVLGDVSASQPTDLFVREPVWRSEGDKDSMHSRIIREVRQIEAVRSGEWEPTKTPTRDCSWDCDFFRMCQLHESGDDWEAYRDAMYHKVDPYADHRKAA
jgi:hypothetical protein